MRWRHRQPHRPPLSRPLPREPRAQEPEGPRRADEAAGGEPFEHTGTAARSARGGFLKINSVSIPTNAGMKTGFYADFSPRNRFSSRHRSEYQRK